MNIDKLSRTQLVYHCGYINVHRTLRDQYGARSTMKLDSLILPADLKAQRIIH